MARTWTTLAAAAVLAGGCARTSQVRRIAVTEVARGLTSPVALEPAPDGSGRLYVVDQIGLIRIIEPDGTLRAEPALDLRDRLVDLMPDFDERGLLGLAFHPDFPEDPRAFVFYSGPLRGRGPAGWDHTNYVAELVVRGDGSFDRASKRVLLAIDHPQFNHNGGTVAFGPDGLLYVSVGDGGGAHDVGVGHGPLGNAQDLTTLHGSILRLDVDGGRPYAIPAGNPFAGADVPGRDEIYAYGLRNPYRFSFDRGGGHDLLVGDVGQDRREEINRVVRGGNYGWNLREGTLCFDPERPGQAPATCPRQGPWGEPLRDPIIELPHSSQPGGLGVAVIGGYVYRGHTMPKLAGAYLFGVFAHQPDSPSGRVFAAVPRVGDRRWRFEELVPEGRQRGLGQYLLGFGQDEAGELYLLTTANRGPTGATGRVLRIGRAR